MSSIKTATALAAVAALMLPASAVARGHGKTHRFAPATDVTVTFAFPKHVASGTVLKFGRNQISLAKHGRTLALRGKRRASGRVSVPRRRGQRIVLTLSATSGQVSLRAGRETVLLGGPVVTEQSVAVRKRVVGFRLATEATRPAATTPSAPSTSVPPPTRSRLFAADSVWNAPLAANAELDPANATLVGTLRKTVAQNQAVRSGPWMSTGDTPTLYTVPADQPTVRVQLDPGSWKVSLQHAFTSVPLPANAIAAPVGDAQITVWQPSTDRLWELFQARKLADGWHASFGGAMSNASQSRGYFDLASWPGLSQTWWGATATSLPAVAGTIMIDELKAGVIPHALAMNIPWAKPKTFSWPAQRTDGRSTDPNAIPEGARFRLDPNLNIDAMNLPPMTKMIAKAAQNYGMIVRDQTGHGISLFAENPRSAGTDPYSAPGGYWGGPTPDKVMNAFPWDRLQLVKMSLQTMK